MSNSPIEPSSSRASSSPSTPSPADGAGAGNFSSANVDPTGVWTKFLTSGGRQPTPQEVAAFVQGIMSNFNVLIQQAQESAKRAHEEARKAIEGE